MRRRGKELQLQQGPPLHILEIHNFKQSSLLLSGFVSPPRRDTNLGRHKFPLFIFFVKKKQKTFACSLRQKIS